MTLKIYKLSHPILKTILSHTSSQIHNYNYRYIGLLLLYEIFRQNIITKKIYIKHIKSIKIIDVIHEDKKYLILTNISETYDMISDINQLIPKVQVIHTEYKNRNSIQNSLNNLKIDSRKSEIFIIEKITKNEYIIDLINYLTNEKKINTRNIKIGSIISNENTLEKIGNEYSELKLYTTKILYNNN